MQPGIYDGISNADYHGGPGVSKSMLDVVDERSPLHLHHLRTCAEARVSTAAQMIGTAFHALILEPHEFVTTYCLGLRQSDAPDAIESRDQLVAMAEAVNTEREAVMRNVKAISNSDELKAMIAKLNEGRLPKLPTTGSKADLVARVKEIRPDVTDLETASVGELKAVIQSINETRPGLLSTNGSAADLAATLRANGADFVTRQEVMDEWQAKTGTPMFIKTDGSMQALADALRANGKDVRLWSEVKAEWLQNNGHRTVLEPEEWDQLHRMRDAVMAHPAARALLTAVPGKAEQSVYWIDEETGELCRCRPDFWREDCLLVDVKTTEDASPEGFAKSLANWRYHVQHPFYVDGVNAALRQMKARRPAWLKADRVRGFVFLAVEKTACVVNGMAKGVAVYVLDDKPKVLEGEATQPSSVELGRAMYRHALRRYAECNRSGVWPGYGEKIMPISVPSFEFAKHGHMLGAA